MVQAANSEVVFDVRMPLDKAVAELKANEPRLVAGVQQMAANASKAAQVHFKAIFNEASVRKRMAEMIRDMERQATNARIEMEARVRLFGPDGQTPLDQWVKKSVEFGSMATWSKGGGTQQVNTMSPSEQWHRMSVASANKSMWSGGARTSGIDAILGGGIGPGGGGSGPSDAGGGSIFGTSLKDIFGKQSALGQMTSLLRGGGAVVALTIALDQLGRMVGSMRNLRDEIRLGERAAGDLAVSFGKSIPVLGKIVTIGAELRELATGENFNLARALEVTSAVGAATQQIFQLNREAQKIAAGAARENESIRNSISAILTPAGPKREERELQAELTVSVQNIDKEIEQNATEWQAKYRDMIEKPFDVTIDPKIHVSEAAQAGIRNGLTLEKILEEAMEKERKAIAYQASVIEDNRTDMFDSAEEGVKEAKAAREVIESDIAKINEARDQQIKIINDPLIERQRLLQNRAEAIRMSRQWADADAATGIRMYGIGASEARASGDIRRAERLEYEAQLAAKVAAAGGASTQAGKAQIEQNRIDYANFIQRQGLNADEMRISNETRKKASDLRLAGDFVGADRLERNAKNDAEIRAAELQGISKAEIDLIRERQKSEDDIAEKRIAAAQEESINTNDERKYLANIRARGDFEFARTEERLIRDRREIDDAKRRGATDDEISAIGNRQEAENDAEDYDRAFKADIGLSRSIADVKQAQLRASQRYYDAEVYAIEQAYEEQIRIAERSEDSLTAIKIAENQRRARMTELNAQAEQRARDAGFEANQIRLRREGKDTEAQRAAIMRQAEDELKQVGSNANAREAIFARTKEQLLELQDMEARRLGSGSWAADSIYSLGLGRNAPGNTLTAANQAALASLGGSGGTSGVFAVAGIAGSIAKAANMIAMLPSEIESMDKSLAGTPGRTDADAKVEIRGEAITYLKTIAENTGKGAVFSA